MDVINLERRRIETVKIEDIISEFGSQYPQVEKVFSVHKDGMMRRVTKLTDFRKDYVIPTFEGLLSPETGFLKSMRHLLLLLETECGFPVDIEFAADENNFYILQCRAQSSWEQNEAVRLKERPEPENILFTADKYVSDGFIPEISHIVYVDPIAYDNLKSLQELVAVGKTVGRLNRILPKRSFVLMGPGRWGSRGDIKLGVQVTYSDINNTAALIEMAFQKGSYVPDLSFGTHFFQDLVEAGIRYLPLYPDESNIIFNKKFFTESNNILGELLPECNDLAGIVKVIDVQASAAGKILRIAMSGDESEAIGYFTSIEDSTQEEPSKLPRSRISNNSDEHWLWRQRMAETLASEIEPELYGVRGIYLFGSTKHATSGPCSDIDLLIHFDGDDIARGLLESYLSGWDTCLCEINYIRTGFRTDHILDVHIITDKDIEDKQSYAVKIGSISDPARPLVIKK